MTFQLLLPLLFVPYDCGDCNVSRHKQSMNDISFLLLPYDCGDWNVSRHKQCMNDISVATAVTLCAI